MNIIFSLLVVLSIAFEVVSFNFVDVYVPDHCDYIAQPTDHLLIEYKLIFANETEVKYIKNTGQLFYVKLDVSVTFKLLTSCIRLISYHK